MKKCPTEAIRVRNGKATIISDRCIDCGECIRVCPSHAKKAVSDSLDALKSYKFNVALPAPTFYGQFKEVADINISLNALLRVGVDDIFEVALAAQSISDYMQSIMLEKGKHLDGPVISSACPAVVRLISVRFPGIVDNVIDVISPAELAAIAAREKAVLTTGFSASEIGVFFISPCPAKITTAKHPFGIETPVIDGAISMKEIYRTVLPCINKIDEPRKLFTASSRGISWATSGGEGGSIGEELYIAADGIENVVKVLDEVENDKLKSVKFVELNACPGGCVGGCLTVENPFVARARIKRMSREMQHNDNSASVDESCLSPDTLHWQKQLEYEPILLIDEERSVAIRKMADIERISSDLPGIDCGSCGAPSCQALAEDIILGNAHDGDCIFKLRERMYTLFREMAELQEYMPPPFRNSV
jgi:iron only hydrogenase large subunit-like protein